MQREIKVLSSTPVPKGYGFLPKGICYKTLHCRKLTHEAGKPLYIVIDKKQRIGLRAPAFIIRQVHVQAKETLPTRRAATKKRDESDLSKAAAELKVQFPKMPSTENEMVLKHGFRKHSGRVGRTKSIPLPRKALLAGIAHVRHKHTKYDSLLSNRTTRDDARKITRKKLESTMHSWGFMGDLSWYFNSQCKSNRGKENQA